MQVGSKDLFSFFCMLIYSFPSPIFFLKRLFVLQCIFMGILSEIKLCNYGYFPVSCNFYYHDSVKLSVMVPPALLSPQGCFGYSDLFVLSEFLDCSL